ncbi:MAG: ArsR/SmtB family transcription factor [bacterium]
MPVTAKAFKALGDSGRLRLFEILLDGPRHVSELVAALAISQPHVSKHLRILKDAGLVEDNRHGRWVEYRVALGAGAAPRLLAQWGNELGERVAVAAARSALASTVADGTAGVAPARAAQSAEPRRESRFVVRKPDDAFDAYLL